MQPIRVLRVIARLNLGGPAHHVRILTEQLDPERFETLLLHGTAGAGEQEMEPPRPGPRRAVVRLPSLGSRVRPLADLRALIQVVRAARRFQPDVVHTHTAKAGMVGRLAALAMRPRPVVVHTYHGHVLQDYFSRPVTALYRWIERRLACVSDRLIGVSEATVAELVGFGIAARDKFIVVPVGLDLSALAAIDERARCDARQQLGLDGGAVVVVFVGRLVPIKRVDVLLHALARLQDRRIPVDALIIGDGPLRAELEVLADRLGLQRTCRFLGYRKRLLPIFAAADIAALTSDNEGTPVSLIEAAAAATPSVAVGVGGVAEVVAPNCGVVVPSHDIDALVDAIELLANDESLRTSMGERARRHVVSHFSSRRLVDDVERLYVELVTNRARS